METFSELEESDVGKTDAGINYWATGGAGALLQHVRCGPITVHVYNHKKYCIV